MQLFPRLFLVIIAVIMMTPIQFVTAQGTQNIVVSGIVTEADTDIPLPGVSVLVYGTFTGTVTDISGRYSLTVPNEQSVLVFSFVGFQSVSVAVGGQRNISISLVEETAEIEEVVVVGYGQQRRESVVGAISQATGAQIVEQSQGSDLGSALRGALPGLVALQSTGMPGGIDYGPLLDASGRTAGNLTQFFVRGQNTWNVSSPLVLVDGVERSLVNVNPHEIERISLLKDASATAVFGVKGANGVILITTSRGREGRAQLSFNTSMSTKSISMVPGMSDSYTGLLNKNYAILNEVPINESGWSSITPYERLIMFRDGTYPEYLPNTSWMDEFTNDFATDYNVNMSVSGGTQFVKYYGSLAYLHEGDILNIRERGQGYNPSWQFDRMNWRSNLDFTITPTTQLTANLAGQFYAQKQPRGSRWSAWRTMYRMPPDTWPLKYSDGTWAERAGFQHLVNGVLEFNYRGYNINRGTDITTDFSVQQKLDFITPGLSANTKFSFDNNMLTRGASVYGSRPVSKYIQQDIVDAIRPGMTQEEIRALEDQYTLWNVVGETGAGYDWTPTPPSWGTQYADNNTVYRNIYYQASLNYNRDFGRHNFTGLALVSRQERARGSEFMSYREDWVGRVTYDYDRRYLAEFNAAYNGSEKFSNEYRFGFFPSVAVGWVASNESFFEPIRPVMNYLKFRYSDGKVGSDEGIERWLYSGSWIVWPMGGPAESVYRFGSPYLQTAYPLRYEGIIANPHIRWETAHKRDIGIETSFFNHIIRLNFDYFTESRTNIFVSGSGRPIPSYYGAKPVAANEGAVDVKGWEFEGQFSYNFANGLHLWAAHSWAFAKETIIQRGDPPLIEDYQKQAGYQIGQPRVTLPQSKHSVMADWNEVYNTVGSSNNVNVLPGDFHRIDFNSDGIVDNNDRAPYGYPNRPQYVYSPSLGFSFNNLSANVRFYGVYNIEGGAGGYGGTFSETLTRWFPWDTDRRWSPENNNTLTATSPQARLVTGARGGYDPWSRAYLRLQSAEIAYTIDRDWVRRMGLSNFQLKISGHNLWLWSKMYEDVDYSGPSTTDSRLRYPVLKRINFGMNINFR